MEYDTSKYELKDRLWLALMGVKEFANLSMDRQGEIIVAMEKAIRLANEKYQPKDGVIYDESGFSSGCGIVDNPILDIDEWDEENDKVGC